jgi:hypothetical protein
LLLRNAESAGAEVRQSAEVVGPVVDADHRVTGVTLKGGERVLADAVPKAGRYPGTDQRRAEGARRGEPSGVSRSPSLLGANVIGQLERRALTNPVIGQRG